MMYDSWFRDPTLPNGKTRYGDFYTNQLMAALSDGAGCMDQVLGVMNVLPKGTLCAARMWNTGPIDWPIKVDERTTLWHAKILIECHSRPVEFFDPYNRW